MSYIPVALYLVYNQCRISIYLKDLGPQVNGFFDPHDACFIFGNTVGALKAQIYNEGYVKILWGCQQYPDTMAYIIGGIIDKIPSLP